MKKIAILLLAAGAIASAQSKIKEPNESEAMLIELNQIAMCHYGIKAAQHQALSDGESAAFSYAKNVTRSGLAGAFTPSYPAPQGCISIEHSLIDPYNDSSDKDQAGLNRYVTDNIGISVGEVEIDLNFMEAVDRKMRAEGDHLRP